MVRPKVSAAVLEGVSFDGGPAEASEQNPFDGFKLKIAGSTSFSWFSDVGDRFC